MSLKPTPMGVFQFENLVTNRVPFFLLRKNIDVESLYGVMEKMHLRNWSLELPDFSLVEAEVLLKERYANLDSPIVVVCETGKASEKLADQLSAKDYRNVYFIEGGLEKLKAERG